MIFVLNIDHFVLVYPFPLKYPVLSHILRFEGDGYVIFQNNQMQVTIPWMNRIMFRTRDRNGLLMYIKLASSIYISIEVRIKPNWAIYFRVNQL